MRCGIPPFSNPFLENSSSILRSRIAASSGASSPATTQRSQELIAHGRSDRRGHGSLLARHSCYENGSAAASRRYLSIFEGLNSSSAIGMVLEDAESFINVNAVVCPAAMIFERENTGMITRSSVLLLPLPASPMSIRCGNFTLLSRRCSLMKQPAYPREDGHGLCRFVIGHEHVRRVFAAGLW
jgi:hypothetical protein